MEPFFKDESVTIYQGDSREILKTFPDQSVNCCVTSPPYYGLRDYGVTGQLGLEQSPEEYIAEMVKVFREVKRVIRDDGTLWLNIGDSYARAGGYSNNNGLDGVSRELCLRARTNAPEGVASQTLAKECKPKDLIGIPWMLAFALRADGWYLRQDIIWSKPNPMPESVTDRCTKSHEYIFLLSKSQKYYYNQEAIKEPALSTDTSVRDRDTTRLNNTPGRTPMLGLKTNHYEYRNKRSVWMVKSRPYHGLHFATFPPDLIKPCIVAGCLPGGVVLDPFAGSGTTLEVSERNGCKAVGIELSSDYCALMLKRLRQKGFQFGGL